MITLTRFNGLPLMINDKLIETVEETPDTVVTMENGHRYFVKEKLDEIMSKIVDFGNKKNPAADKLRTAEGSINEV
ncbi:MAG: flagellar FlbD family protein [Ruminococcus sp.]|jgi:flagellar protein FlbD|nr:flagellar FlbD family protein [Ruminococcus sp.]